MSVAQKRKRKRMNVYVRSFVCACECTHVVSLSVCPPVRQSGCPYTIPSVYYSSLLTRTMHLSAPVISTSLSLPCMCTRQVSSFSLGAYLPIPYYAHQLNIYKRKRRKRESAGQSPCSSIAYIQLYMLLLQPACTVHSGDGRAVVAAAAAAEEAVFLFLRHGCSLSVSLVQLQLDITHRATHAEEDIYLLQVELRYSCKTTLVPQQYRYDIYLLAVCQHQTMFYSYLLLKSIHAQEWVFKLFKGVPF